MPKPRILIALTCLAVAGVCWMKVGAQGPIRNEPKDYATSSVPTTYDTPARRAALRREMYGKPASLRMGQLIGMSLKDKNGVPIGTVRDLVVDTNTGALKYAMVRVHDLSDATADNQVTLIPWSVVRANFTAPRDRYLEFRLHPNVLTKAPAWRINDVEPANPEFGLTADRYFHDPNLGVPEGVEIQRHYEPPGGVPFQ